MWHVWVMIVLARVVMGGRGCFGVWSLGWLFLFFAYDTACGLLQMKVSFTHSSIHNTINV